MNVGSHPLSFSLILSRFRKLCLLQKEGLGTCLSMKLFAGSLLLACVMNIPCAWIFGRHRIHIHDYGIHVSFCFIDTHSRQGTIFLVYSALLGALFLAVCTILVVLYCKIVKTLRNLSVKHDSLKGQPSPGAERVSKHKQSQVMRSSSVVFIVVTIVFFVSHIPYFLAGALSMSDSFMSLLSPAWKALYDLAKFSPLVNTMANPVIYSFTSSHFRSEVKRMLTFQACAHGLLRRRTCSSRCTTQGVTHGTVCGENV